MSCTGLSLYLIYRLEGHVMSCTGLPFVFYIPVGGVLLVLGGFFLLSLV